MKNFEYINASTLTDALKALDELGEKAFLVAGGTNVMVYIRSGKRNDRTLVNIRGIDELRGISVDNGVVCIGALTTLTQISKSETLKVNAPGLYAAGNVFADPTTRNSATIGGNVANAGAGGDTIPSLMVLNAVAHLKSLNGGREIPVCDLFTGPGRTCMAPNEILTHFTFKAEPHIGFIKMSMRNSMSIAMASAAAYVKLEADGTIADCRLALGAVAPTPVRARNAEKALIGNKLDDATFAHMGEEVQKDMNPREPSVRATITYRREVMPVLVKRALKLAAYGECM
ncbi:MAG: FAD binding domain-containing protein [Clostridia bacterium]